MSIAPDRHARIEGTALPGRRSRAATLCTLLLGGLLILMAGCEKATPLSKDSETVRLGLPLQPSSALLIVALETGAFADVGIAPVVTEYPSGRSALSDGLLVGREDLVSVADVPVALAGFEGEPVRVIASLFSSDNVNRVVARRSLGITAPEDLAGRRVATQRGSAVHFFWHLFSLDHRMHAPNRLVYLTPEELPGALAEGRIDAFSMREPFVTEAGTLIGEDVLVFSAPGLYVQHELLVTDEATTRERGELLGAVIRAMLAAEDYCRDEPAAAQALVAARLGVPLQKVADLWSGMELSVRLDQGLLLLLEEEARWALHAGLLPPADMPNYLDIIDTGPLDGERPRAVTLIR
ncbi:ABC transporter substrate-binding protein [Thiocapsa bogorovii]|uniref:ABC transporter substrate-binding protein n=1 Tax=Thiocapsa bogorovii TaxID=521689 RepID=UPI001E425C31|nr:ABC transporter substrate-binding protein [Thiocapsa bogorovii]UHD15154.1 ABC transporter substrate-binding protein [Thiocapsa bogorovii]